MKSLIDFIREPAALYLAAWVVSTVIYIAYTRVIYKRCRHRVNELDIEAKGLILRLREKDRVIESLNHEVNRLNAKVKKEKLIMTLEDLNNEQNDFTGDARTD